jgi:hypothetical protein
MPNTAAKRSVYLSVIKQNELPLNNLRLNKFILYRPETFLADMHQLIIKTLFNNRGFEPYFCCLQVHQRGSEIYIVFDFL